MLHRAALVVLDLHGFFHRNADFHDLILKTVVFNGLFKIDLHLVLVSGIGMNHIPFDLRIL